MTEKKKGLKITLAVIASLLAVFISLAFALMIEYNSLEGKGGIPRLDVYTEDGAKIDSREVYVNCTVSLSGTDEELCFDSLEAGIRGRGNSTWTAKTYRKKPYRIKFAEKTSLFGEPKNKSWVLLALFNDFTLTKDRLAFSLADSLGGEAFVPAYHYVELYLNGSYNGIYLLTDQVDENRGRTDVKLDFTEEDISVPFLVELDEYAREEGVEDVDWFSVAGYAYNLKYPEADERYTDAQFNYIKSYITEVDLLMRKEGVTLGELEEYINLESFIDFYLIEELLGQPEINWKSVYMSKKQDGKLVMGPIWDFDWCITGPYMGDRAYDWRDETEGFRSSNNWFDLLLRNSSEFRTALAERWFEIKPKFAEVLDSIENNASSLSLAARRDTIRWHWYRIDASYERRLSESLAWCRTRMEWFDSEFESYRKN